MKIPLWVKVRKKSFNTFYRFVSPVQPRRPFSLEIFNSEIEQEKIQKALNFPALIISFDDISTMKASHQTFDFGGNEDSAIVRQFTQFLEASPNHRSTLFYIPAPNFKWNPEYGLIGENTSLPTANTQLISKLKSLSDQDKVEIAQHGLHHIQNRKPAYYSSFEFEWQTESETFEQINSGYNILNPYFDIAGFKPPAWSVGQLDGSCHLPKVLTRFASNYDYVCLSSPSNGLNYSSHKISHIYPGKVDGLLNIPQNISILWDLQKTKDTISKIVAKNGIVNIQLHFSESRYGLEDGICDKNLEKLTELCSYAIKEGAKNLLCREVSMNMEI